MTARLSAASRRGSEPPLNVRNQPHNRELASTVVLERDRAGYPKPYLGVVRTIYAAHPLARRDPCYNRLSGNDGSGSRPEFVEAFHIAKVDPTLLDSTTDHVVDVYALVLNSSSLTFGAIARNLSGPAVIG